MRQAARYKKAFSVTLAFLRGKLIDIKNDKFRWLFLQRISNSFLSKTLTGISLSTIIISNFDNKLLFNLFDTTSFYLMLFGGLFFLAGHVIVSSSIPDEFIDTNSLNDAVIKQKVIEYFESFQNRIDMTSSLCNRFIKEKPFDMSDDQIKFATIIIKRCSGRGKEEWKDYSASLYLADLNIRQYQKPEVRVFAAFFLFIGIGLTIYSTVSGVFKVTMHLFLD